MTRIVVLLTAILAVLAVGCGGGTEAGPLAPVPGNSSYATSPAKVGQIVAFGLWLEKNTGSEAVIRSIEPAQRGLAKGLELRYAGVKATSNCRVGALYGWPPPDCVGDLLPISGFRVPKGVEGGILVGASATAPGHWLIRAFRIRYEVNGRSYESVYPQGLGLNVAD